MVILGIDPGFNRLGYAVLKKEGGDFSVLISGFAETPSKDEYTKRIVDIGSAVHKIILDYKPDMLAIEKLFFTANQKTALKVAEIKGIVLYLAAKENVSCLEFTPLEVKLSVCGYGKADKRQVRDMLKLTLKNTDLPKNDDACDAIALALTGYFYRLRSMNFLAPSRAS